MVLTYHMNVNDSTTLISAGHIRNIHFPFNIVADSAMSVASEMVAELDLSDQDVTTIAEMIDVEILALVPEWNPGVAVDENGVIGGEHGLPSDEDNHNNVQEESDIVATMSSEGSGVDHHPISSRKTCSHSPKVSSMSIFWFRICINDPSPPTISLLS